MPAKRSKRKSSWEQLTDYFERLHHEHVERERVRHGEFAAKLRDVALAPTVMTQALKEVEEWEARGRPPEQVAGWRALLSMAPEDIAQVLEENVHPLLHVRHGESPFRRELTEEEHRQLIATLLHREELGKDSKSLSDKCRLSVDEMNGWLYRLVMSESEFPHPGSLVRQNCLERFDLSVTAGAKVLGVSRQALTNLLSGKAGISPEMALRLDLAFGGGAETWLQRQLLHDLAQARRRLAQFKVVPIASERQPALF
jgi:antitoxin HigA-1